MYTDKIYVLRLWTKMDSSPALLNHLFRILHFLGAPRGFQVNWWRFPADRIVAPGAWPTRAEVNGGWTYMGNDQIWIFRDEEWDRVLIHECIHAFKWDAQVHGETKACLDRALNGTIMMAIFEAATELNAEWLYCIIHSPPSDFTGKTWTLQRRWQDEQAQQIVARSAIAAHWTEDTSVFAYYVLKAVLARNMETFLLDWLAGTLNTEYWCDKWAHNAHMFDSDVKTNMPFSMRMSNPAITR